MLKYNNRFIFLILGDHLLYNTVHHLGALSYRVHKKIVTATTLHKYLVESSSTGTIFSTIP